MKTIRLRKGRERSVLKGHPWVFSGAVESGEAATGELVEVCDSKGEKIALGWYSPASQIRVRIVPDAPIADLVANAVARRGDFFVNCYTNAVRLVNAENDLLPGVVADYYAGHVVCQFTSAGADARKAEIANALMKFAPGCVGVSERLDADSREKEGLPVEQTLKTICGEEPPEFVEITEGQVKFLVDVRRGHKTGFYLDQRDARATVGRLANGADVLNCFCYSGGFGLFARACGAESVTQVDISGDALALAKKNEALQHYCGTKMEYVEADVFQFLRKCRDAGRKFDFIVLDPPKFAASKGQLMKAARGYKDINLLAMKLLKPYGTLATFSCSGAMDAAFFDTVLAEAAEDAHRKFQVVARTRAGADHPVLLSFPEGAYLKGVVLRSIT
ncbi:MAG: class I SAM-dependent rRNA methyltransferase [Kiritimatiellae bacterium]|nr:class I SAM-dependent rRNA methyltransferase [Kiritimatiellia bacterium]